MTTATNVKPQTPTSSGHACAIPSSNAPYAGDVMPQEAFQYLSQNDGLLIDVRTPEEWADGVAELPHTLQISFKTNPGYVLNPNFSAELTKELADKNQPLFFMCKGGGRSQQAAEVMTALGYSKCYNIAGGFESVQGWKAAGLPWKKGA